MKEIPALRSIFIFNKDCRIDSNDILEVKIETDDWFVYSSDSYDWVGESVANLHLSQ